MPDAPDTADDGFRQVFTEHRTRVFRLAVLMTGNVHVAEEVTAEVFARVLPRWRAGGVTDVLPYLRRAVVNETRSRHRRREHEARAIARWGAPATVVDTDRVALAEPLLAALRQLPARQRAVVVLRYHDDLSEADVASTLGMAPGSVKSHASRGLAQLRTLLDQQEESR
ncbi:MAG: sigma-70 family RNA polymerase sigma factor [Actinobacteria bacterium]|nr:sigma-70 family RNA polymerase sigma factor [Actinomycetota bacterium]